MIVACAGFLSGAVVCLYKKSSMAVFDCNKSTPNKQSKDKMGAYLDGKLHRWWFFLQVNLIRESAYQGAEWQRRYPEYIIYSWGWFKTSEDSPSFF